MTTPPPRPGIGRGRRPSAAKEDNSETGSGALTGQSNPSLSPAVPQDSTPSSLPPTRAIFTIDTSIEPPPIPLIHNEIQQPEGKAVEKNGNDFVDDLLCSPVETDVILLSPEKSKFGFSNSPKGLSPGEKPTRVPITMENFKQRFGYSYSSVIVQGQAKKVPEVEVLMDQSEDVASSGINGDSLPSVGTDKIKSHENGLSKDPTRPVPVSRRILTRTKAGCNGQEEKMDEDIILEQSSTDQMNMPPPKSPRAPPTPKKRTMADAGMDPLPGRGRGRPITRIRLDPRALLKKARAARISKCELVDVGVSHFQGFGLPGSRTPTFKEIELNRKLATTIPMRAAEGRVGLMPKLRIRKSYPLEDPGKTKSAVEVLRDLGELYEVKPTYNVVNKTRKNGIPRYKATVNAGLRTEVAIAATRMEAMSEAAVKCLKTLKALPCEELKGMDIMNYKPWTKTDPKKDILYVLSKVCKKFGFLQPTFNLKRTTNDGKFIYVCQIGDQNPVTTEGKAAKKRVAIRIAAFKMYHMLFEANNAGATRIYDPSELEARASHKQQGLFPPL